MERGDKAENGLDGFNFAIGKTTTTWNVFTHKDDRGVSVYIYGAGDFNVSNWEEIPKELQDSGLIIVRYRPSEQDARYIKLAPLMVLAHSYFPTLLSKE